jgi:hypothetical protein
VIFLRGRAFVSAFAASAAESAAGILRAAMAAPRLPRKLRREFSGRGFSMRV